MAYKFYKDNQMITTNNVTLVCARVNVHISRVYVGRLITGRGNVLVTHSSQLLSCEQPDDPFLSSLSIIDR